MSEVTGRLHDVEIGGTLRGVELLTRKTVHIRQSKVAASLELKEGGPARIVFIGGGHIDVCGDARIWAIELRIAEILESRPNGDCESGSASTEAT